MRKLSYLIVFALLGITLAFISCEDEEVNKPNKFTFKIDGEQKDWSSTANVDNSVIGSDITAYEGNDTIKIFLNKNSTGVYTDENEENNIMTSDIKFIEDKVEYNTIYSHEGYEIEITKFEDEASVIEGNFSGTCATWGVINERDSVVITKGEFYIEKDK
jgi:hypothetical protein